MNHCSYVYNTTRPENVNSLFNVLEAFKKTVAPAGYKNKQAVSRRRYLAVVL